MTRHALVIRHASPIESSGTSGPRQTSAPVLGSQPLLRSVDPSDRRRRGSESVLPRASAGSRTRPDLPAALCPLPLALPRRDALAGRATVVVRRREADPKRPGHHVDPRHLPRDVRSRVPVYPFGKGVLPPRQPASGRVDATGEGSPLPWDREPVPNREHRQGHRSVLLARLVPGLRPVRVPREDHEAIVRVLAATGEEVPTPEGLAIPLATRAEIDARWPGTGACGQRLRGRAEGHRSGYPTHRRGSSPDPRESLERRGRAWPWTPQTAGWPFAFRTDGWPYPYERRPLIRLSYRWYRPDGQLHVPEGFRTGFPANLHPGDTTVVPMTVAAPEEPGNYLLEVDLVHEYVRWFDRPRPSVRDRAPERLLRCRPGCPSAA